MKRNMTGLRYRNFSVIYMQTFALNGLDDKLFDPHFVVQEQNPIDEQIFVYRDGQAPVKRYILPSFSVKIGMKEPYYAEVEGKVYVELSVFFNRTVIIVYKLKVDGVSAKASGMLTTDHLISLAALSMGAEHWNSNDEKTCSNINLAPSEVKISDISINDRYEWVKKPIACFGKDAFEKSDVKGDNVTEFDLICGRYKNVVLKSGKTALSDKPYNFVYLDIWETVDNYDGSLQRFELEEDMVKYIKEHCKSEMIGLMTLYPSEWPYRDEEAFDEVCGSNIAIDTDDYILLNNAMCVCFGTYGRRSEEKDLTGWDTHLAAIRARHHVSWPEYLLILEMVLAKKFTIDTAMSVIVDSLASCSTLNETRDVIERNSRIELVVTDLLLKLDAVNYSKFISHKVMFDRTIRRLDIKGEEEKLRTMMDKISNSMGNLLNMRSLRQSAKMSLFLGAISVASLFQIIFTDTKIPYLRILGFSDRVEKVFVYIFQGFAFLLVFAGIVITFYLFATNTKKIRKIFAMLGKGSGVFGKKEDKLNNGGR